MQLDQAKIEELIKRLQDADSKPLNSEEIDAVREVLVMLKLWKSLGFIGRMSLWTLMTLASALIAWQQIKDNIGGWFG